jgi:hypothetical protein
MTGASVSMNGPPSIYGLSRLGVLIIGPRYSFIGFDRRPLAAPCPIQTRSCAKVAVRFHAIKVFDFRFKRGSIYGSVF